MNGKLLLKRVLEVVILTTAIMYIGHTILQSWPMVVQHLRTANFGLLFVAWIFFLLYFVLRATAWRLIMTSLGSPIPPVSAGRIWFLSEFSRYVPGNVWSFLGRIHLAEQEKVPRRVTAVSLAVEILLLLGSAAAFIVIFLLAIPFSGLADFRYLSLLAIPAAALLFSPSIIDKLCNLMLRLMKRESVPFNLTRLRLLGMVITFMGAWAAYGYASYLVAIAFTPLAVSVWWLVSAFIIAWLIGYISIVTPMGLGVREGAIIAFLSPITGTGLAGLIAIASRLWLIVSELTALAIISVGTTKKVRVWLAKHWQEGLLALGMIAFIAYNGAFSFLRQANFLSGRFDLGIMDQTVWNTANGHFFKLIDPNGIYGEVSRFSIHADTLLILIAPLYKIVASPYTLLAIQVVSAALGALGLYLLGKLVLKSRSLALLPAFAYLLFPPLINAVGFEFHAETVITSCLIFAFYFLYTRRYLPFAIFALLSLTGKETMAFTVIMFGIYALWTRRDWRVGVATITVSVAWFYILLWHIMPGNRSDGTAHFALSYYSQFGSTPEQILKTLVTKPQTWISQAWQPDYLAYFAVPTAFALVFSPLIFLMALPELLLNLLSSNPPMHTIFYQYTGAITPFAFIAMVFSLARILAWLKPHVKYTQALITAGCIIAIAISSWNWSPLPGMPNADTQPFTTYLPAGKDLDALAKTIPASASVSATDHLTSHFSEREYIYPFPEAVGNADYLVIKDDDDTLGFDSWADMQAQIQELRTDPRYNRIYQNGTVEVYEKVGLTS